MEKQIAVIGMAGRFPDAGNIHQFYQNLLNAKNSIRDISAERVKKTTLEAGKAFHKRGYMEAIDLFDYEFFRIPYTEAIHMDPHQRLLLEVVHEALENAAYSPDDLSNTPTAVFVANRNMQYYQHADQFDPTLVTGNASEFLAARINRVFNLRGGVAVIDTSCSSGLVALHHACNELKLGLADQALVCAANLELFPYKNGEYHIEVDSPTGNSIPFTAASDGMVYGETVLCVLLKPLIQALKDRDNIQAIITGSAVNNNAARAASLTAPDSHAQAEVLIKAWSDAGIQPYQLSFIEAHGSATQLGDSLEIAGINLAVENYVHPQLSIPLSTVKSNIGHTRSAAGLAGFVKAVLSIKEKMLLPSRFSGEPNVYLQQKNAQVAIQQTAQRWQPGDKNPKMIGAVSSIGFSGTNCHVVIEENKHKELNGNAYLDNQPYVFLFSANSLPALQEYVRDVGAFLENHPHVNLRNLSFSLGRGRKHYACRKAFVAGDAEDLSAQLRQWLPAGKVSEAIPKKLGVLFIFSDAAKLNAEMVQECCRRNAFFDERYRHYLEMVSVGMERTAPKLVHFVFQLAYYDLLKENGIQPAFMIGLGTGKILTRIIQEELSVEEGMQQWYAQPAEENPIPFANRVSELLRIQTRDSFPVFIDMGMGSDLYEALLQQAELGKSFQVFPLGDTLPVTHIAALQAFVYENQYDKTMAFFASFAASRMELPARSFAKTRCWLRNEPKVKTCEKEQPTKPAAETAKPVPPEQNSLYEYLNALWQELLSRNNIQPGDHFFDIGGDSLKASAVIQQLNKQLNLRLSFEDLFDYPVLKDFIAYIASSLSVEQQLLVIWAVVLRYPNLKTDDDFFAIGGHSLLANQVLNRVKTEMGVRVDFEDFFLHPSIARMTALVEQKKSAARVSSDEIPAAPPAEDYPASHLQRRLWIVGQMEESSVAYNECNIYRLEGEPDIPLMQQVYEQLVRRHEAFRTVFRNGKTGLRQLILPWSTAYELEIDDRRNQQISTEALLEEASRFALQPFNFETGPLVRAKLVSTGNREALLLFNIHHIIFDEWSNQVFLSEFIRLYESGRKNLPLTLEPLRIQYKDYAVWLEQDIETLQTGEKYWLTLLKNGVPPLNLPTDRLRPPVKTYNGSSFNYKLPVAVARAVETLARNHKVSSFMVLTALSNLLFHRYTHQPEIILGTPVAGRINGELEKNIGFYANTVLLKTTVTPEQTFAQMLQAAREMIIGAYTHQTYPFDLLLEKTGVKPDRSRLPLFDVMIGYQKVVAAGTDSFAMSEVRITPLEQPRGASKFDLSIDFMETAENILAIVNYNTDLFDAESMERLLIHFGNLALRVAANDECPVAEIDYIAADEKQTPVCGPIVKHKQSLSHLWEEAAAKHAGLTAIQFNEENITYQELAEKSKRLTTFLLTHYTFQSGDAVAVLTTNVIEKMVSVLALQKLGATVYFSGTALPNLKLIIGENQAEENGIPVFDPASANSENFIAQPVKDAGEHFIYYETAAAPALTAGELTDQAWWFRKNIKAVPGSALALPFANNRCWLEWMFAALLNGQTVYTGSTPEQLLPEPTPTTLWLTGFAVRQLLQEETRPSNLDKVKYIITEDLDITEKMQLQLAEQNIELFSCFRPAPAAGLLFRFSHYDYPFMAENVFPNTQLYVCDAAKMPVPPGIDGFLHYTKHDLSFSTHTIARFGKNGEIFIYGERETPTAVIAAALKNDEVNQVAFLAETGENHAAPVLFVSGKTTAGSTQTGENKTPENIFEFVPATVEDEMLYRHFNETDRDWPYISIIQYLEKWAAESPSAIAVRCGNHSLTYHELNAAVEKVAAALLNRPVQSEEAIPVFIKRSPELLIAMLAIFKAGCAYLPLNMDSPAERVTLLLKDCRANALLTTGSDLAERFSAAERAQLGSEAELLDIHTLLAFQPAGDTDFPELPGNGLAYIIYTSGSTGMPKGAMIEHAGMMNHLFAEVEMLGLNAGSRIIQNAPQSFDISVWQLLVALVTGGQTIIYPDTLVENPAGFARALNQDQPHMLEIVPSYLSVLLDLFEADEQLRQWRPNHLFVTGETFPPALAKRWLKLFPGVPLVNAYGPTEASDDIAHYIFTELDETLHRLPVGHTIANMKIYILGENGRLCAIGTPGEICVSGIGVGRGYLNQREKTQRVFVPDPFNPTQRMYKTGDMGFMRPDGMLEFIGRSDNQVKVHGHRIELEEIEHCLFACAGVKNAVVLSFKDDNRNDFLVAYVTGANPQPETIKDYLKSRLPFYMVPQYILPVENFPLTPNGKTDRKAFANPHHYSHEPVIEKIIKTHLSAIFPDTALPRIVGLKKIPAGKNGLPDKTLLRAVNENLQKEITAPANETETILLEIWKQELGTGELGVTDDFFENGGHSLKGMRLLAAIEKQLGCRLGLKHLFQCPTVRKLAACIAEAYTLENDTIQKQPAGRQYPLSFAQQRMWVMGQLGGSGHAYNSCGGLQLTGVLNREAWNRAWQAVLLRHEILRSRFLLNETGVLSQEMTDWSEVKHAIQWMDFSGERGWEEKIATAGRHLEQTQFDLENGPLLKGVMMKGADNLYIFIYAMHHIIADEWSLKILSNELLQFYLGFANHKPFIPEPLPVQYHDYAAWQQENWQRQSDSREYWLKKLGGEIPVLDLPVDKTRPAVKTYKGLVKTRTLKYTVQPLQQTGRENGATLFMNLLAAVNVLLYRYCSQTDLVIGVPVSGRNNPQLQNGVGLYLNTLALRTQLEAGDSYNRVIKKVRETVTEGFTHQEYPFDKLVEELDLKKDLSRSALFDVLMVMHDEPVQTLLEDDTLKVEPWLFQGTASKFDLSFHFRPNGEHIELGLIYNTDLFSETRMNIVADHFEQLLLQLIAEPGKPVRELTYFSKPEFEELYAVSREKPLVLPEENITTVLEKCWNLPENAKRIALADEQGSMLFPELHEMVDKTAACLQKKYKIQPGQVVGLQMNRGRGLIVAMLAILKTGAAYLPIDTTVPEERLHFMLADSGAVLLVSDTQHETSCATLLWNEGFLKQLPKADTANTEILRNANSIAYLIYTSGTSGKPKAVPVRDISLINYVRGIYNAYNLNGETLKGLLVSSPAFDLGYTCLWGMLLLGGELHLLPQTEYWQPLSVLEWIRQKPINFIKLTPSHFRLLLHECAQEPELVNHTASLKWVILGGEALMPAEVNQWLQYHPQGRIINHYGPTETTIGVLTQVIGNTGETNSISSAAYAAQPVLGKPMGGHQAYITDATGNLCGKGVWGELWICGPGVATGYYNQPELSAAKFSTGKFPGNYPAYRTGDRCRFTINGSIEFGGRLDAQIQLNGYRVETEEIEKAMTALPGIQQAAVLLMEGQGAQTLTGYFVASPGNTVIDKTTLIAELGRTLPKYMVPQILVPVTEIPLTGNGKPDRKKLPVPAYEQPAPENTETEITPTGQLLLETYGTLMGRKDLRLHDRFFETGGDSIRAIQLVSLLYRKGWKLEVKDIFENPVLEDMAALMQPLHTRASQEAVEGELPLSPVQYDFFARNTKAPHHYNQYILLKHADGFRQEHVQTVVNRLMEHHDALRICFPVTETEVTQYNKGLTAHSVVTSTDLRKHRNPQTALHQKAGELQAAFNLAEGPLFKAALYRMNDGDRLLLLAHHLVVDGISWRILLEDFYTLYEQTVAGAVPELPPKSESFHTWTTALHNPAVLEVFRNSLPHWLANRPQQMHRIAEPATPSLKKDMAVHSFSLAEQETRHLLYGIHHAYHTEISDLLLAALSAAVYYEWGNTRFAVAMEGHGRTHLVNKDISRTVGWFTSIYPVLLDATWAAEPQKHICHTKELLRQIPDKGTGYSILKWICREPELAGDEKPQIIFNYLGQFDDHSPLNGLSFSGEKAGAVQAMDEYIEYPLSISGKVAEGKLVMVLETDPAFISATQTVSLARYFQESLQQLIQHCLGREESQVTLSDLQYKGLTEQTLDSLFD